MLKKLIGAIIFKVITRKPKYTLYDTDGNLIRRF